MSTVGDILTTVGVFSIVGDILSTMGVFSTMGGYHEYRGSVQYRGENLLLFEYPTVLNTPTVLMISPTVLNTPMVLMISPHGTEHPLRYSRYPPHLS